MDRRAFLSKAALAAFGARAAQSAVLRQGARGEKTLVLLFLRGAADGLNIAVPHGDKSYYALRPTIAVPRRSVIDLDGFFGLHPSLAPLKPIYDRKNLAVIHAAGSPDPVRSHLDAQLVVESGAARAISGASLVDFPVRHREFHRSRNENSTAAQRHAAGYPPTNLGHRLAGIAQAIKSGTGPQVAVAAMNGWDHHINEVGRSVETGALAGQLRDLGASLAAFDRDLDGRMEDVLLVTLSEFGRSARENALRGTGHGRANFMFLMGGNVNGGRVHAKWPGLEREQLDAGGGLAVTTDYRHILAQVAGTHLRRPSPPSIISSLTARPEILIQRLG